MPESGQPHNSLQTRVFLTGARPWGRGSAHARPCNLYSWACKSFTLALLVAAYVAGTAGIAAAQPVEPVPAERVQRVVDALRRQLGITALVSVSLVESDPRVVSVRASGAGRRRFDLRLERAFVAALPQAQLEAALAHELGHVWISTHHPYLQTEQLANRVAMRVVSREHLVDVYRTLWGADALHGSLETFLGVAPATTTAAQQ